MMSGLVMVSLSNHTHHMLDLMLRFYGIHRGKTFDRQTREGVKHRAALGRRKRRLDVGAHARQCARRSGDDLGASLGR